MRVEIKEIEIGLMSYEDLFDKEGTLLVSSGVILTENHVEKLRVLGIEKIKAVVKEKEILPEVDKEDDMIGFITREKAIKDTKETAMRILASTMKKHREEGDEHMRKLALVVGKIIENILRNEDIVLILNKLKTNSEYQVEHSINVAFISLIVAVKMGLKKEMLTSIGLGAILHDFGMINISDSIVNKPGALTEEEYRTVKTHAFYGESIVSSIEQNEMVQSIIKHHHERLDGSGYPDALKGQELLLPVRIVAVADSFDAMTSQRPYRERMTPYAAILELIKHTDLFDREVIKALIMSSGYYPLGSHLKLSSGEIGTVIYKNIFRPTLRIIFDKHGHEVKDYYIIDLKKNPSVGITDFIIDLYEEDLGEGLH